MLDERLVRPVLRSDVTNRAEPLFRPRDVLCHVVHRGEELVIFWRQVRQVVPAKQVRVR